LSSGKASGPLDTGESESRLG
jgi:hypothetical protein